MHDTAVVGFLANMLAILLSAKLFGELAERLDQPAVLGELLGGVFLGFGLFSFFRPQDEILSLLSEFGIILLLFATGLESDLEELLKVGPVSLAVAAVGVAVPFLLGWGVMRALGHGGLQAVFVGAALTATSVGITARVLSDMGKLQEAESKIVLGAAVIDDILGIVVLSAVQGMASSGTFSWWATARSALLAVVFLVGALWIGRHASAWLLKAVDAMKVRGILIAAAIVFAFTLSLAAHALGTALIVGAFTAGALLAKTDHKARIDHAIAPVTDLFAPVFFVMVGAQVQLGVYNPLHPENRAGIGLALLLVLVAVVGKLVAGWAVWEKGLSRWRVGIGMVPRGEVGLIFAQVGLAAGVIDPSLYAAVVGMVVVTTFAAPVLLKRAYA